MWTLLVLVELLSHSHIDLSSYFRIYLKWSVLRFRHWIHNQLLSLSLTFNPNYQIWPEWLAPPKNCTITEYFQDQKIYIIKKKTPHREPSHRRALSLQRGELVGCQEYESWVSSAGDPEPNLPAKNDIVPVPAILIHCQSGPKLLSAAHLTLSLQKHFIFITSLFIQTGKKCQTKAIYSKAFFKIS